MQSSLMKNIGAKNFGYNVKLMKWSNRMDLLAFSNNKGFPANLNFVQIETQFSKHNVLFVFFFSIR